MKDLLISLFVRSGLLSLWRYRNRKKITVLALHGVTGPHSDSPWFPLWERPQPDRLDLVIRQLSGHYRFITMDHAVRILEGRAPPVNHGAVVTFDDGYRNNFVDALPVLKRLGVPATFFIATGYVETNRPYWNDRLDYALQHAPDDHRFLSSNDFEFDLRGLDRNALANEFRELRLALKGNDRDNEELLKIVEHIGRSLESASETTILDIIDKDPFVSVASWAEQADALKNGATIGSHSVDHCELTSIPEATVDEQLVESKRKLEEKLGRSCEFFCYPSGCHNDYVLGRVREAGYRAAFTTEKGLNRVGDDLYALKRYPMPIAETVQKNLVLISGIMELPLFNAMHAST